MLDLQKYLMSCVLQVYLKNLRKLVQYLLISICIRKHVVVVFVADIIFNATYLAFDCGHYSTKRNFQKGFKPYLKLKQKRRLTIL